jgi:hypothetical protein
MGVFEGMFLNLTEGFADNFGNNNTVVNKGDKAKPGDFLELGVSWGIGTLINILITLLALYFYFKCNWSKGGKFSVKASNLTDKLLGFLASCCCSICYIAYHLAIPC